MKKNYITLIAFCLISIFLLNLSLVSAFEFDNVKSYNAVTREVTIKNAFGFGAEIGKARLNTPLNVKVARGYQKVAEFDLWAYTDYNNIIKNIDFYDKNKNYWKNYKFKRSFDIKYKRYKKRLIDDYDNIFIGYSPNGTALYEDRKIGEHFEEIEIWEKVNPAILKKNEKVTIGIFTEVKKGDYVEWIPYIYGVEIGEWSSWTESLNTNLVYYWALEDNNANTTVHAQVGTNGVLSGGNTDAKSTTGKVNLGFDLDGSGDYITVSDGFNEAGDFSVNMWINADAIALQQNYFDVAGGSYVQLILSDGTGDGKTRVLVQGSSDFKSTVGIGTGAWNMMTLTVDNGNTVSFYINGQLNGTASGGGTSGTATQIQFGDYAGVKPFAGLMDEVSIWERALSQAEVTQIYNEGNGLTWKDIFDANPTVELNSPSNNTNYTTSPILVNFTCYASDDFNLTSVSLYIDGVLDQLNATGINNTNYTFSKSLTQGSYNWSCEGTDNKSQTTKPSARLFKIHSTPTNSFIYNPTGIINYHLGGTNLTLNWSINETGENLTTHITNCTYEYNGIITEINNTVCTVINQTTFTPIVGINNLTFTVTEEFGFINTSKTSWTTKVFEINQTYNNATTEGSLETFLALIRLGSGYSIADAVLINYNGSSNTGQSFASGDNTVLRKVDFLIPNVNTNTNITFYWNITLSDSTNINLSSQNQTVYNLGLDNCSSFTTELYNFSVVDEKEQTILPNATIEIAINIYDRTRTILVLNYSAIHEKINPLKICLNRNLSNSTIYSVDVIIRYEDTGFANEYYNIVNSTLTTNSSSQLIILYDLNSTDSTDFQLSFIGSDFLPIENALVYVDRQYISENTFKTVELPKTDYNGQAVLHLVRNDVIYNIRIIKDKIILGNFENLVAFCDDFTIGDCNIELNAFDSVEGVFNYDDSLGIIFTNPTYNATTDKVSFNFVTSDGSSKTVLLEVTRNDIFGNRSICNASLISSGGTLTCNVDPNIDESTLNVNVYVDGILEVKSNVQIETTNYGVGGYLIMFVMALTFILIFSGSKTGVLISIGLTLASSIGMGLISGTLIGIGASGIWLLVILFIGIYKLNSERQE